MSVQNGDTAVRATQDGIARASRAIPPAGRPIYFRAATIDAYQGSNMTNFMAEKLGVKSVYILDDSRACGVGRADASGSRW